MVCYRETAFKHYRAKLQQVIDGKFNKHYEPQRGRESFKSEYPNVDIRHENNFTKSRWTKEEFKNQKFTEGWTESDKVEGWDL